MDPVYGVGYGYFFLISERECNNFFLESECTGGRERERERERVLNFFLIGGSIIIMLIRGGEEMACARARSIAISNGFGPALCMYARPQLRVYIE